MLNEILNKYSSEKISDIILDDFKVFFNTKSQRDQILCYFKAEPNLTNKDLLELFPSYQVNTLTQRLFNAGYIDAVDKDGKYIIYKITIEGERIVDKMILNFLDKNIQYQDYVVEKRKEKINGTDEKEHIKTLTLALVESNLKPTMDDKIKIDLKEFSQWNYEAAEFIYGNFNESLKIIKEHFKNDVDGEIKDEDIIFINPHQTEYREIHDYDRDFKGLIYTKGLITSKKEAIVLQILKYYYLCLNSNCEYSQKELSSTVKLTKYKCPKCKSVLEEIKRDKVNHYESKISNIDSGVSFPLVFRGEKAKQFAFVGLGDEIEVIGHLEDKIVENNKGQKEEIIKCLVVNSFRKTDYQKELTEEEIKISERIIEKNNIKEYLLSPFVEYIEKDWFKELLILQQLTRYNLDTKETPIHLAIMGEPGVGKNEFIRISEKYFPVCDSIVGADITDAGFKGTVNRDTGIKEVGLAKKTQNGTIFFNEFDKFVKSNNNGKKAASQLLNASITEQEVRLNKAGIKIKFENLDLRHNVVFNPTEERILESGKAPHNFMGEILDKSLLSRMIPVYIPKDKERSLKVMDLMLNDVKLNKNLNSEEYKTLIKYLRVKQVHITSKAKEKIKSIFKKILQRDSHTMISPERIAQVLTQLSKAVAKLNNREEVLTNDVKQAYDYYFNSLKTTGITLDNLESLFQDKTVEELETEKEVKLFIEKHFADNEILKLDELYKCKNKEIAEKVVLNLKKTGSYAEFNKGELKEIK